jgi:RNA polymerase sigma factor for flagellar operon FliA
VTRALAIVYLATQADSEEPAAAVPLVDRSEPPAPAAAIRREIHQKLHELIDALPAEAATLIRATYFEGLTLQEAGTRLGVSKSWASRLHAKTLQRLARSLRLQGVTS